MSQTSYINSVIKKSKNNKTKDICNIYTIQGLNNKKKVIIKYLDTVKLSKDVNLTDTMLETFEIKHNVSGNLFACNITNNYLTSSRKLPMIYIDVWWGRGLQKKMLYRLFLYFNIEQNIKTKNELINKPINGSFSIEIINDNKKYHDISPPQILNECFDTFPDSSLVKQLLTDITKKDYMLTYTDKIINDEEKIIASKYSKEMDQYINIPKATIKLSDINLDDYQ